MARLGTAGRAGAGWGVVWQGKLSAIGEWLGRAWLGETRIGAAGHGPARQGKARFFH